VTPQLLHEILAQLTPGHQYAVQLLIERAERLERSMRGIASCATDCGCCAMHRRIAEQALARYAGETEGAT
jgi:hypothetical protein